MFATVFRRGCCLKWGMKFSTNALICLQNGTRYGNICNGRQIGIPMRSIEWCHYFQRYCVSLNWQLLEHAMCLVVLFFCHFIVLLLLFERNKWIWKHSTTSNNSKMSQA